MTDKIAPLKRSANMAAIRSKNTKPEMIVRRLVHGLGYRYRLHRKNLPGNPDLVFGLRKKVIFVHGCFWHQHDDIKCLDGRLPKSRLDYWLPKLEMNQQRDRSNQAALADSGWQVITIWDCETKDTTLLEEKLKSFLD